MRRKEAKWESKKKLLWKRILDMEKVMTREEEIEICPRSLTGMRNLR